VVDRIWHSWIFDAGFFWGADCDTDHCLVFANVMERMPVNEEGAQKFYVESFSLKNLSVLEVWKKSEIKISNRIAALENLNDSKDIIGLGKVVGENIKTSGKESLHMCEQKHHKVWVDEKCLFFRSKETG
jgi:hypothetical protein